MNMNFVSNHARVLEGVRLARIRAFDEAQLPDDQYHERCVYNQEHPDDPHCDRVAKVLWVQGPAGVIHPLCERHLDSWASDERSPADWHPPVLVPLLNRWHP